MKDKFLWHEFASWDLKTKWLIREKKCLSVMWNIKAELIKIWIQKEVHGTNKFSREETQLSKTMALC